MLFRRSLLNVSAAAACDELHKAGSVFRKRFPCICLGTSANACIRFTLRAAAGWFRRPAAFRGFRIHRAFAFRAFAAHCRRSQRSCCRSAQFKPNQPCFCLCFGFSQITRILPFLLIILHFSQIGFTDDLTFMSNPPSLLCLPTISGHFATPDQK